MSDCSGWLVICVLGLAVGLGLNAILPSAEMGLQSDRDLLLSKVLELRGLGFKVDYQDATFTDSFAEWTEVMNFTDWIGFLNGHSLFACVYSFRGSYGPKLWLILDGIHYFWRPVGVKDVGVV